MAKTKKNAVVQFVVFQINNFIKALEIIDTQKKIIESILSSSY